MREWAHLSLDARCAIINEKYKIEMSRYTLSNIYKELKIGYLKTHSSFYNLRSQEEYRDLILVYLKKVVKHMKRKREIIFIDETSTDMWDVR